MVSERRMSMSSGATPSELPTSTMSCRHPLPVFQLYSADCGTLSYPNLPSSSFNERTSSPLSPTLRSRYRGVAVCSATMFRSLT